MQDLQKKLDHVRSKIEERVYHSYLSTNIDAPMIDEDKLLLLVSILDHTDMPLAELENYAVTTMLIQIALDTHEKVTNAMTGETNQQNRQLTILAGVYYSGLYYKLLAEQNDFGAIRMLAEGIETVNEQKIMLYHKELDEIEKLMTSVKKIEFALFERLTAHFHIPVWNEIVANLLLYKRLIAEKEQYKRSKSSVLFDALRKVVFPKQSQLTKELSLEKQRYLNLICDRYIDFSEEMIVKAKSKIPFLNEMVDDRISLILNQHQPVAKSLAEEG